MRKIFLLFVFLFTMQAEAVEPSRCGTDSFGNSVCMDKDGVLTNAPKKPASERAGGDANAQGAQAGAREQQGNKSEREATGGHVRCGTDPFGNTVCR